MPKPLSILCFGNSLTAGYFAWGTEYHPYDDKLKETLKSKIPGLKVMTYISGLPGDLVVFPPGSFLSRMQGKCAEAKYDWVICLGGTNDIGYSHPADKIYAALQVSWNVALESGAKVLALTVPECKTRSARLDGRRDVLNASILAHQAKGFYAFDLRSKIPYHDATEEWREEMFDDGLHMTAKGYDFMGTAIAEHLADLIIAEETLDEQT
ncbi:SGNH hydrolase [Penicillium angulare]|uniref:SGNH hydrolase n=1 Tax=Penicillium angulare TaxID=116970 RepID=UPI00253FCB36|nr:SGNH hydrolase [Penicillium angulare]KAJ5261372.1 SGNH hydrolase [Penicillium angulare]